LVDGKEASTVLSDLTFEPLFQIFLSWATVRQSTLRPGFVTTAIPSLAIWTSP